MHAGRARGLATSGACRGRPKSIDWIVAASETYHVYPSLSAVLHGLLKLRENCSALDVGSGCLALVQALAVAQSILGAGRGEKVLVVTSDVHSRTLGPGALKESSADCLATERARFC